MQDRTQDDLRVGAAIAAATGEPGTPGAGTQDAAGGGIGLDHPPRSIVAPGSAASDAGGIVAADPRARPGRSCWPAWAREQLEQALDLASQATPGSDVARLLHARWFSPVVVEIPRLRAMRPLAGAYRNAHAGSRRRHDDDGVPVIERHDVAGADGWWRTWGSRWTPPRTRPGSVHVVLTPLPGRVPTVVATATDLLIDADVPWSLACSTRPQRLRRSGGVVLDLPSADDLPEGLLERLSPSLAPVVPPLCLPIAPGAGIAGHASSGMGFGEQRCRLIATALQHPSSASDFPAGRRGGVRRARHRPGASLPLTDGPPQRGRPAAEPAGLPAAVATSLSMSTA